MKASNYAIGLSVVDKMGVPRELMSRTDIGTLGEKYMSRKPVGVTLKEGNYVLTDDLGRCDFVVRGKKITKVRQRTARVYSYSMETESELLESGRMMFNIGKGQRTRKKAKVDCNRVIGKRTKLYGRIVPRPVCI